MSRFVYFYDKPRDIYIYMCGAALVDNASKMTCAAPLIPTASRNNIGDVLQTSQGRMDENACNEACSKRGAAETLDRK